MIKHLIFVLAFLLSCANLNAQTINLDLLGKLTLEYQQIEKVSHIPSKRVMGQVGYMRGYDYVLNTPIRISRLSFLLDNGGEIKKGEAFAKISGPDVHHFMAVLNAKKQLLSLARTRLENSRQLFNKKLIDEDKWLKINQNYFSSQLEFEHLQHFAELIKGEILDDTITITAPTDGIFIKANHNMNFEEGEALASFVSSEQVKIKMQLPAKQANEVDYIQLENCQLKIANKSRVSRGAFVEVWSESVKDSCQLLIGDLVSVQPFFKKLAYRVAKNAVFSLDGKDQILIKNKSQLEAIEVELVTSSGNDYLLYSSKDLTNAQVLISSVSAAQGILLGLGGE